MTSRGRRRRGGGPYGAWKKRVEHRCCRGRRRRGGRGVLRAVPAPPSPTTRLLDQGVRRGRRRGGNLVLEPVPRRPVRHPDAPTTPTASTPSSSASGRGRRSTRPSRRSSSYLRHVADRYDLRRDIEFSTRVESAAWDESATRWRLRTDRGEEVSCRFYVMASGCLSLPKTPDIEGAERFRGRGVFHEQLAPRGGGLHRQAGGGDRHGLFGHPVDPAHRRPGRPAHRLPAHPELLDPRPQRTAFGRAPRPPSTADRAAYREAARWSRGGVPVEVTDVSGATATEEVRRERFEAAWEAGELFEILGVFNDLTGQPGLQRGRGRDDPREDPLDRRRSGHRRGALPQGPPVRHQAAVPRHQLLRDLQPSPRPPRRPAQASHRHHHRVGDRHR